PTVLDRGSLGDFIKVSLIWFPLQSAVRLCWEVVISLRKNEDMFRILVDADNGQILYCTDFMQSIAASISAIRATGGVLRPIATLPLPLAEYGLPSPADLPPGFPDDWVFGSDTSGNAIRAVLDSTGATVSGVMTDGSLLFDPADPSGDQQ